MKTADFNYHLPAELIAQKPTRLRDHSRLMIVDRGKAERGKRKEAIEHCHFYNIVDYLDKGDLLVWNNSKVFKARLFGSLVSNDGRVLRGEDKPVEVLLVRPMGNPGVWKVLARPGKHVKPGMRVVFGDGEQPYPRPPLKKGRELDEVFYCEVVIKEPDGSILVQFPDDEETVRKKANKYGVVPVPPYIKGDKNLKLESYQTVYARDDREGSVAAPTAGFHFTPELIEKLKKKGVEFAEVTLHVGLGTFLPVKSERLEDHVMHSEWVELTEENAEKINRAKSEGRRVVAVGTTTVRTLEGIAALGKEERGKRKGVGRLSNNLTMEQCNNEIISRDKVEINEDRKFEIRNLKLGKLPVTNYKLQSYTGEIDIFIRPGFNFQIVDALITNFHLPKSTLLMLVSALAGNRRFVLQCYQEAVSQNYRFYSFGDAMFIY
ncbi:MAG: S-adenosylmethionine:tRNA ribosyltransferase-isomerase [Patescibacteria group bacterium]